MKDLTHKDIAIFSVLTNILTDIEEDLTTRIRGLTDEDIEQLKEVTFTPEDIANFFVKFTKEEE